jgi:hypothetical protein
LLRCFVRLCVAAASLFCSSIALIVPITFPRAHPDASPRTIRTDVFAPPRAPASFARPMAFGVLFALLAFCSGQTVSPTTSPSPSPTPCSASPGYFCSGGSALICPIGAYCAGGSALNVSCYPLTACTVAGLSAQPPCFWLTESRFVGSGSAGSVDGLGTMVTFNCPAALTYQPLTKNLYLGQCGAALRIITPSRSVSTPGISVSYVAAFDSANNLIYANNWRILNQSASTGISAVMVGSGSQGTADGQGTLAEFWYPDALTVASNNAILISDSNRVRTVSPTGIVSTLAGNGVGGWADGSGNIARFNGNYGITWFTGQQVALVADQSNHRIRTVDLFGNVLTIAGNGALSNIDGIGTTSSIFHPRSIAIFGAGIAAYITTALGSVRSFSFSSLRLATVYEYSASADNLEGITFNGDGIMFLARRADRYVASLTCLPCPVSFYCLSGAPVLCPAGSYCPLSSINAVVCPKGSFSNAGASTCTLCSAGTFTNTTGSTSCQQCPGGHFCPAGTSSWARLNCGRGNYCPDGSGAPTPCPYQVPPTGGWGALQVQGPAFLVETAQCLNHCFWNLTSGDGTLSKC